MKLILWILAVIFALGVSGWLAFETQTEFSVIVIPVMAIIAVCLMLWMATNLKKSTEEKEQNSMPSRIYINRFIFTNVGLVYRNHEEQKEARALSPGAVILLEEDPDNEYDSNAIKVLTLEHTHIGYVPAKYCSLVKEILLQYSDNDAYVYATNPGKDAPWIEIRIDF